LSSTKTIRVFTISSWSFGCLIVTIEKQPCGCYLWCELRFNIRGGSVDQDNTISADYSLDVKPCTKRLLLLWFYWVILFGIITIKSTLFDISLILEVIYSLSWLLYLITTCIDNVNIISKLIQLRKLFKRTEYNFNGAIIQIQLREIFMKSEVISIVFPGRFSWE
jgi:hypothetical protein